MAINKNVFLHESDKAALKALQAIPGFSSLMKAYLKAWNEKLFYIQNMSSNIHINDNQLKKYKDMLPQICEKLGIEIPDLFLQLNPYPNSYTSGDSKPFIVITSGLIENLPERLIPTVLAHECGHIACHHVLYRTMGQMILNGAIFTLLGQGISALLTYPIRAAFYYWMRCSEYSADRAAILCDGSPDKMIEVCARLSGFSKNINEDINIDAFINQANEYKKLIEENSINKTMEFMSFAYTSHPMNALRASEAISWSKSDNFIKSKQYFDAYKNNLVPNEIPITFIEKDFINKNYLDVCKKLEDLGFEVKLDRITDINSSYKHDLVTNVMINGSNKYEEGDWIDLNSEVIVSYYKPYSEREIEDMHPGEVRIPNNASYYVGKDYKEVDRQLFEAGLFNTSLIEIKDLKKENNLNLNKVISISIDGNERFLKGDFISIMSEIVIKYHGLENDDE